MMGGLLVTNNLITSQFGNLTIRFTIKILKWNKQDYLKIYDSQGLLNFYISFTSFTYDYI